MTILSRGSSCTILFTSNLGATATCRRSYKGTHRRFGLYLLSPNGVLKTHSMVSTWKQVFFCRHNYLSLPRLQLYHIATNQFVIKECSTSFPSPDQPSNFEAFEWTGCGARNYLAKGGEESLSSYVFSKFPVCLGGLRKQKLGSWQCVYMRQIWALRHCTLLTSMCAIAAPYFEGVRS